MFDKGNIWSPKKGIIKKVKAIIISINDTFIKRHNKGEKANKLDFKSTLYASSKLLNTSSIDNIVATLKIDKITSVTKNCLIKKRNLDNTHLAIKKLNDEIILKRFI